MTSANKSWRIKEMKKVFALLLALLMMAGLLAGCGGGDEEKSPSTEPSAAPRTR